MPDTVELVAHYTYFGAEWINTFYAFKSGGYSSVTLQAVVDATAASIVANLKPLLSSSITYAGITARGLNTEFDIYASNVVGVGIGGIGANICSAQAAYCVTRYSALTGRSARGRVYLPAPTTGQLDTNNHNLVTSAYSNAVLAALGGIIADQAAIDWDAVIVSRQQGGVVLATAETFPQTGWRVRDLRLDTQRRRLSPNG